MFGSFGKTPASTCITFVSRAAISAGLPQSLGLRKIVAGVVNCRNIGKKDMVHNQATPNIQVDPETYEVLVDDQPITCEPATVLPLTHRYYFLL